MSLLRPDIRRLLQLDTWRKRDATRDMRDEMELHTALRAEQLQRDGMSADDARAEARRLFAASESTIEELHAAAVDRNRSMRSRQHWDAVWHDLRYAARRLVRDRATTSFILLTLALGIGALTGTFGTDVWLLAALGAPLLTAAWAVVAMLRRSARTVPHGPSMCVAAATALALAVM